MYICIYVYIIYVYMYICIYVYMYILYMYICIYVYVYMYICIYYICIYVYMYICIYVYMYICIYYICIYVYMYICINVYIIYVYMYICIYVYMYICIYYICIYVYMYICIYIYVYMYIPKFPSNPSVDRPFPCNIHVEVTHFRWPTDRVSLEVLKIRLYRFRTERHWGYNQRMLGKKRGYHMVSWWNMKMCSSWTTGASVFSHRK